MPVNSLSFDDDSEESPSVFSGQDLLRAYIDEFDLDWEEILERRALDARRGLVVMQVTVLEELINEVILYVVDPVDVEEYTARLNRLTFGPRLDRLERESRTRELLDDKGNELISDLRALVSRRNELAHGTLHRYQNERIHPKDWATATWNFEWDLYDPRSGRLKPIKMSELRHDLEEAIGCFMEMLEWGNRKLAKCVRRPVNFTDGWYISLSSDDPAG